MIIYFADRQQIVTGQASTGLPHGLIIIDDVKTEDIDTGVASFDVTISYKENERLDLEQMTEAGNYVFRSTGEDAECYTIIDAETDTKEKTRHLYCEDAGLDLLNIQCDAFEADSAHNIAWYINYFAGDSGFEIGNNEIQSKTRTLSWDGEATGTERIRSIATQFDNAEISYSFVIENLEIKHRYINIYEKRGVDIQQQLRLDRDINNIIVKRSVANLITAVKPTGDTLEGEDEPLDLIGYTYDDGDIFLDSATGVLYSRSGLGKWARPNGGYIQGSYTYTTESQSELCNRAVSHLERYSDVEVNYDVDIVRGLENTHIGDRVNIVDDAGEVYVSGRILRLETSITGYYKNATLGEYLIKTSGLSEQVLTLASDFQQTREQTQALYNSVTVIGETVDAMLNLEVESTLVGNIGALKAHLYNGGKEVTTQYSEALYKWIKRTDQGEEFLGRGYTLDLNLEEVGYAGTVLCRFLRPVLYDLTDHMFVNITDENGENIQVAYAGIYSQPVLRRTKMLRTLNRASEVNETGYPTLVREVNLYDKDGMEKVLAPIKQHFWTDDNGAHITEVPREDFDEEGGGNLLARSDGVSLREGNNELSIFTALSTRIGPEDGKNTLLDQSGVNIRNGATSLAKFADNSARIGVESGKNTLLDSGGIKLRDGSETLAEFTSSSARIGATGGNNIRINTNGLNLYAGNTQAGRLHQKTNYIPPYVESTYNNAMFVETPELFAVNVGNKEWPAFEAVKDNNLITVDMNFGKVGALTLTDNTTCRLALSMSDYTRTNQSTFIEAYTEDSSVMLGIGSGGINHGVYSNSAGAWLICMDGSGQACIPNAYAKTTSAAANLRVNNTAGVLLRSTSSSERYKKDIKDIEGAEALYDVKVRQFKYREDYLDSEDIRYGKDMGGFIVEELEKVYPIAVDYESEQPEDWNVRYMVPPMLKLIQEQKKEIDELREMINELAGGKQ